MRQTHVLLLSAAVTGWLASAAVGDASGHPGIPQSLDLSFQRGGTGKIAGVTTFGLLLSEDVGDSWHWICEEAIGYGGIWDSVVVISGPGTLFATTPAALRISRDGGCSWVNGPGALATAWAADLVEGPDDSIWVVTSNPTGGNDVQVSRDDGRTFTPQGLSAFVPDALWTSIRVAPSDPNRIYVTGYHTDSGGPRPLLFRHDVEGWTAVPFSFGVASRIMILGVSPTDPDLVFARIDDGLVDTVLRSDDGGLSWAPVTTFMDDVSTFVAWPDGELFLGTESEGTRRSLDNGLIWTEISARLTTPTLHCGHIAPNGELWGCGANWEPDRWAFGRSLDRGATWTKIMRFSEIMAPLDCPDGTPQDELCEGDFARSVCTMFNCDGAAGPPPDAPLLDAPGSGASGEGGGCGCGVAFAAMLVVPVGPLRRRRRRVGQPGGR